MRRRVVASGSVLGLWLSALLALGLPGRASALMAGSASGTPPDSPALRIDANSTTSHWRGVVSVMAGGNVYSGALVGRRHVLTAAHVLAINNSPPSALVQAVFNLGGGATIVAAASYTLHPSYGGIGVNDLALIQLQEDAPSGAIAYPMASSIPAPGTVLTLVGYGDSGDGQVGISVGRSPNVKRVGSNAFDYSPDQLRYFLDFDGPGGSANFLGATTLGNAVETTLAGGDSGSPAFVGPVNAPTLVGVNAFTALFDGGPTTPGTFGTAAGGTFVAPYRSWIDATIAASGYGPGSTEVPELGRLGWLGLLAATAGIVHAVGRSGGGQVSTCRRDENASM